MKVKKIELNNFRNYSKYTYVPKPGLNIITGENGVGKTNLVEAIYYLNLARGFKNKKDSALLKDGEKEFIVTAQIETEGTDHVISGFYSLDKNEKKIFVDNKPVTKFTDLNKYLNVLLFTPSFSEIFKGSPQDRRDYLNLCISKVSSTYFDALKKYKSLLKERNLTLKREKVDRILLITIDRSLISLSKTIVSYRSMYIKKINSVISSINEQISNKNKQLKIIYTPIVSLNNEFEKALNQLYQSSVEKDIMLQTTSIGVHKEDFAMQIDGKDISIFGSQAENRLAAISLVISSYLALKEGVEKPIIILDDALSELDETNQDKLISLLKSLSQVFITSTETQYKDCEYNLMEAKQ